MSININNIGAVGKSDIQFTVSINPSGAVGELGALGKIGKIGALGIGVKNNKKSKKLQKIPILVATGRSFLHKIIKTSILHYHQIFAFVVYMALYGFFLIFFEKRNGR